MAREPCKCNAARTAAVRFGEAGQRIVSADSFGAPPVPEPGVDFGPEGVCRFASRSLLGHGFGAILRRYRPAPIADGRAEGSHAGEFELICFDCGDNPGLDYSQVSPRLQRIRGPRTMETAWTAYERHLGLARLTDKPWMRAAP